MAKRKTVQQKEIEDLTRKSLDEIGRKVTILSARNSKVDTGRLRDSRNYRVKPFNVLIVSQRFYGRYNTPKGKATPADRTAIKDTPLLNSIRDNIPEGVKFFVKNMIDLLKSPITGK